MKIPINSILIVSMLMIAVAAFGNVVTQDEHIIHLSITEGTNSVAKYELQRIVTEKDGSFYYADLPQPENELLCEENYIVLYYELVGSDKNYMLPIGVQSFQLVYDDGGSVDALPLTDAKYELTGEIDESARLVFLPVGENEATPKNILLSYSIREGVSAIYSGTTSVRIIRMGSLDIGIDDAFWSGSVSSDTSE